MPTDGTETARHTTTKDEATMARRSYEKMARERAAELGVDIDENADGSICISTEPETVHLNSTGCHSAVTPWEHGITDPQMWKDVLSDMELGVTKCENENCECLRSGTGYRL